jgi:glycosyltransferase involved in cell wall biosynthesis
MGGPIVSVAGAAEALVRKGHKLTVVTTNANLDRNVDVPIGRPVDVHGVEVWYLERKEPLKEWLPFAPYFSRSVGFLYAPAMTQVLEKLMPAVEVVNTQMPFIYPTYVATRMALRMEKPLFYHQRGNFLESRLERRRWKKNAYIALFEKPVIRRAAGLIALTEAERAAFRGLAPATACEVIPNGVDVPLRDETAAERVEMRYGIPRDALLILYFGRLETWKGADELLGAFRRYQALNTAAYLVMAGVDECNAERRWRGPADAENYGERLFFTGAISGLEKEDMLHRADLFVLPSSGEGLSMATLEALAHGTAVMLSPECHFPAAEQSGAGVTVEKDVGALTRALCGLGGDRSRLRRMGEAGRRLVERDYSWDNIAELLLDFYSRGLAASRSEVSRAPAAASASSR